MRIFQVVALALAFLVLMVVARQAASHGTAQWIMDNPATESCCGPDDCAALPHGDVDVRRTGYYVKSWRELVPFSEAKPSIDEHYWLCANQDDGEDGEWIVCFFAPAMGS